MAVVKVVDLISKAQTLLLDATGVRWPVLELQGWLNDSYRDTVNLRPDCNTQTGSFACAAGPRQILTAQFAQALRLIEVVRNIAPTSDLRAVRLISRSSLDSQIRDWYGSTQAVTVEYYMYDPRLPKEFLVYPPASSSAQLEVVYSTMPLAHTLTQVQLQDPATAEVIRIDDSFANALLDYMLYRAFSKDAEVQGNATRAVAHFQAFQNALGVKGQTEAASKPGAA